jgi:hypothetical protein
MLGKSYYSEYYRDVKNLKVKDCLVRIAEETEEDFKNYEKILKEYGCEVIRPELDPSENLMELIENKDYFHATARDIKDGNESKMMIRPPAQPRDGQLVMGNEMLFTGRDHPSIKESLMKYNSNDVHDFIELYWDDKKGIPGNVYEGEFNIDTENFAFDAPTITPVGKRVYIDRKEIPEIFINRLQERYPEREFVQIEVGGHSDGNFHTLKPGAIISCSGRFSNYGASFPGWDVCFLDVQSWNLVDDFLHLKKRNKGKWWLAGEEKNNDFTDFVETWLTDWVGYCEESVFDVNVLMLDDKHVCVNNYNKEAFAYFKKHNIEPIIVPFRHRYFWDGGLHCITLDLCREGGMENYFE